MNDYISILKKDLLKIVDLLIGNKIIDSSFEKFNLSIDFMSSSKQGDVSSNLYIILRKFLIKEKYNLKESLHNFILNLSYIFPKFIEAQHKYDESDKDYDPYTTQGYSVKKKSALEVAIF